MPSFEIPDSPAQLELRNQAVDGKAFRVATSTFTVTNKSAQTLSGRFKIVPQGDAKVDWLKLEGEKERPFGPSETQKVNVSVSIPGDVPAGEYKFRLVAMNVNDPDNDFTESAVVTFSPPKIVTTTTHTAIWPYIVAAVVLVLIVGGFFAYKLLFSTVAVPNVVGQTKAAATTALSGQGFAVQAVDDRTPGKTLGTVVTENPPAGTQVSAKSTVTIGVAAPPGMLTIPNVVTNPTMAFAAARQKLVDAGFTNVATAPVNAPQPTGAQPGTVVGEQPAAGTQAPAGKAVTILVDPGVAIPVNLIGTSIADVGSQLQSFSTSINLLADNGTPNIIASFSPSTGPLALHAPLTVNVHSTCLLIPHWRCFFLNHIYTIGQYQQLIQQH